MDNENKNIPMFDPTRHFNKKKEFYMKNLNNVFEHGCFINGSEISKLERELESYVCVKNAIAVSSGTDALLIALMALNVTSLDEVVTVPFTWISTVEVIRLLNAKPVFCDINQNTYNMDVNSLKNVITKKTKVVIPVSLFGQIYDVKNVKKIVNEAEKKYGNKIYIIEDAAQSFGSFDNMNRKSCSVSDIGCTSFFPSKPLGCFGDGGMCFTDNDELANKMRMIKNHGCLKRYEYKCIGINGRLDTIQASILLAKLPDFEESLKKRISNAEKYNKAFEDLPLQIPIKNNNCNRHVYGQYTLMLNDEKTCDKLFKYLKSKKISCGKFYPVCLHLVDAITKDYKIGSLPVSESVSKKVLSLPVYSELTDNEIYFIINSIRSFFEKN